MNLVPECPDISDSWKGNITQVAEVLGLDRCTIRRAAMLGKALGGLDYKLGKNGRKVFSGKEVKRFWRSY